MIASLAGHVSQDTEFLQSFHIPQLCPMGLGGRWLTPDEFDLEYIILGDFFGCSAG
jgi:hypothetical protein